MVYHTTAAAGQRGHLGLGFGDRRWWRRDPGGFQRPAIRLQGPLPRRDTDLLELRKPACTVRLEVVIMCRFGDPHNRWLCSPSSP